MIVVAVVQMMRPVIVMRHRNGHTSAYRGRGSLLPTEEDTDEVHRPPTSRTFVGAPAPFLRGVDAPHRCPRGNQKPKWMSHRRLSRLVVISARTFDTADENMLAAKEVRSVKKTKDIASTPPRTCIHRQSTGCRPHTIWFTTAPCRDGEGGERERGVGAFADLRVSTQHHVIDQDSV